MLRMQIDPYADYVVIEGERLNRPRTVSPGQWLEFWEWLRYRRAD